MLSKTEAVSSNSWGSTGIYSLSFPQQQILSCCCFPSFSLQSKSQEEAAGLTLTFHLKSHKRNEFPYEYPAADFSSFLKDRIQKGGELKREET